MQLPWLEQCSVQETGGNGILLQLDTAVCQSIHLADAAIDVACAGALAQTCTQRCYFHILHNVSCKACACRWVLHGLHICVL